VSASYGPQGSFAGSGTGVSRRLTVGRATAKAHLKLSAKTVTFGHEQREHLTVTVSPRYTGVPSGKVAILAGPATVCRLTLRRGSASCTLSSHKFRPGSYRLHAHYDGSSAFKAATSAAVTLRVRS
jgi:hypothetical protein